MPGVQHVRLKGLRPADAEELLCSQGISGDSEAIQAYLKTNCDCHPLVTGVLAGLINDYLPDKGNFDKWAADASPIGGARLNLADLDLVQRKNNILRAAIEALPEKSKQLLSTLALLSQAADYETLIALNPHLPPEVERVEEPAEPEEHWRWTELSDDEKKEEVDSYNVALASREEYEEAISARLASADYIAAPERLSETVKDLEKRGLLQYDRNSKRHDLHPVVRGVAGGGLRDDEKQQYGQRVVDHFSQKPHNLYEHAETFEDVQDGVQVVRTLMQMGSMQDAMDVYRGDLSHAMVFNLEAEVEIASLIRPFFPDGWTSLPVSVEISDASYLGNDAGAALSATGSKDEALLAFTASLRNDLQSNDCLGIQVVLCNISFLLEDLNRLARASACLRLGFDIATANKDNEDLFCARLFSFSLLTTLGRWNEAEEMWKLLDPMGRDWVRPVYRLGDAEVLYSKFRFERGDLQEDHLTKAENLTREGRNRIGIRALHGLRGTWRAERGEWDLASESLLLAVTMAREVRQIDAESETLLALAQFHMKQLSPPDARHEAERLALLAEPANRPLAELWLAIGDRDRARKYALAAYTRAWADGEPYVLRAELTKSTELLTRLGESIPNLSPYDPTKDPPFEWEAEVEAAIERLKKENAERDAKEEAERDSDEE